MATPSVLAFDAEGRAIDFEVWVDDLQLFLQCDRADGLSLFDLTSGASPAPAADTDPTVRSQWATRDAAARLAVRRHLPTTERAHFSQYKSAQTLYNAVVARYSSPTTAALSHLMLPYLFPNLTAFPTVADLITHLCTSDTRYRAALRAEFCAKNPPPIRSARRLPPAGDAALARARGARARVELAGAVEVAVEAAEGVGVGVGVVAGVVVVVAAAEAEAVAAAVVAEAEAAVVAEVEAAVAEGVELVGVVPRSGAALVVVSASSSSSSSGLGTSPRLSSSCGGAHITQRYFGRLTDAWHQQFPEASEIPRWGELSRAGVAIFDLDFDAILAAMYAVTISDEGDCYWCFSPDPGIGTPALGACEAAALGASASALSSTGKAALSGTASTSASLTFTLDSGASRSFFRDRTTLTPLGRPVAVSLADPSGGPVLSHFSTVLPCPAAPSGTLSGLYLPSFSTNLVSGADLQDAGVHQFTPASQRVAASGQVFAAASRSGPESAPCSYRLLSHKTLLWHHRLGHPSLPRLRSMASRVLVSGLPQPLPPLPSGPGPSYVPCVEGRLRAATHSSQFPPTEASLQTLHMDVWGSDRVRGQGHERYFLLMVDDYSRYTTFFPLRSKGDVTETFTLPDSPQQNGIAERRIGMVMDVARTSMMHAAAPHFLWPFAVRYAAHQINLHPRVSRPETSPALLCTGKVGDVSAFRVWGSRAFVRDLSADKLFPRAAPCVSQVDAAEPVEVTGDSGTAAGADPGGADSGGAARVGTEPGGTVTGGTEPEGAEPGGAEPGGTATGGAEPGGAKPRGATSGATDPGGAASGAAEPWGTEPAPAGPPLVACGGAGPGGSSRREPLSPQELREWFARRWRRTDGAGASSPAEGAAVAGPGAAGPSGPPGAGAAEGVGAETAAVLPGGGPAAGAAGAAGGPAVGGAVGAGAARGAEDAGAVPAVSGVAARPRPYFFPLLQQPASRPPSPVCAARASGRGSRQRPPPVPGTHRMSLRPSTAPLRAPLPSPPESSLPALADLESDSLHAASPTVTRLLATVVTDHSFESNAASALVAELVDFVARCRLDYAASLVAESAAVCPPSVGDPDALDIPTPRSYVEAVEGPYSSQWQAAMDVEMASWKSTGTYVDAVPPPGANIVSGMWIFRVKRPPGSPPVFKARYVAHGFSQRQGVDYFQTFSPTPNMATLRVLLHIAAQRDYELHSLDFSIAFSQGSLHEEIWLRRPPGFTGTFPPGTQWSLRRPVYGLRQAPHEWHDTLRTTLAALGFAPSTAGPSLFLRTNTSLLPFYILVYVDDLVFATADTAGLAYVKSELQKRHTCTDLGELRIYLGLQITRDRARRTITLTKSHMVQQVLQRFGFTYSSPQATPLSTRHSLSALPSDESVESSGPYPELVGCLMYVMTCSQPDLAYPLSILARYVAPGRHRPEHMAASKRVLRYLCSTSGMGLVLGGRSPVVLTGHADASWADDQATQRSSQGYAFSLGSGSLSWRATRSSSVLGSSCEAEIYAGAMATQELRWLTYLLTDLGELPCSPPVLYVDNKAMLALCREQRLEHRTKHIALRYFLARELQQRGQLRLAYVASEANTADVFTKALPPCDHQRFCTQLGLVPVLPHLLTS
ncbi:unnamed protein product [Closterium sp. NIES-65]|nr:unnamed protein product [Closterium sp. NIES-65]